MLDLRTDEELMLASREGDDAAFEALVLRLRATVGRFLRHLGCDEATVDDLVQEALVRLWLSRERYEARAALRTYALTIAKNLWLTHRERARRAASASGAVAAEASPPGRLDSRALSWAWQVQSPEYHLIQRHRAFRVREAICALPETQRLVFVLAHIEDLPYAQIGQILGIAEGTVKSRMHRAVRNLRLALADER